MTRPTVIQAMTPFPLTIESGASCIAARSMMVGHEIRHLPVVDDNDAIIGVVSMSDLELSKALTGDEEQLVSTLCIRPAVRIDIEETLRAAVRKMSLGDSDAAVVERHGRLAGIITLTDISDVLLGLLPGPFFDNGGPVA
jgi:CBS domain-containing protein